MITRLSSERVNFWTHFVGFVAWIPLTGLLVLVATGILHLSPGFRFLDWGTPGAVVRTDLVVVCLAYGFGAMFMFFCSAWYHRNKLQENERSLWRTLDHFAIFVMIAGSYTPVVWIWFDDPWRVVTLAFQWTVTLVGLGFKVFVKHAPRWVDPVLYLLMGWVAVLAIVPLFQKMPPLVFFDLFWGGVWYTVGAVIYALKKPNPLPGRFGFHELFHVFILGGAVTHGSMVLRSLIAARG